MRSLRKVMIAAMLAIFVSTLSSQGIGMAADAAPATGATAKMDRIENKHKGLKREKKSVGKKDRKKAKAMAAGATKA